VARLNSEAKAYLQSPPAPRGEAVDLEISDEELDQLARWVTP
jgi:hypothetical protein